jgi:hypothetical protein
LAASYCGRPLPSEKAKLTFLPGANVIPKKKPMTIQQYAVNPPSILPKTDNQRIKELKEIMIRSGGKDVAEKVIQIALNDNHPGQMAALKMCMDRSLPVSMFEKEKGTRSAVNITISGIGAPNDPPIVIDTAEDASYTMKNSEQE